MKYLKIFSHIFHTFLILCNVVTLASEYQSHYAHLDFSKPTNNVSLTGRISPRPNTSKQNKSYYPTREQLAVVTHWMQQLYPHKNYTPSNQKTSQYKKNSQASATIATPSIVEQKYLTIDIFDLENRLFVYQQLPEWDTHKHIIDERKNALDQIKNGNQKPITQRYAISEKMQRYCNDYGINTGSLELCQGDILQQTIHHEFVDITKKSSGIWHKDKTPKAFKQATNIIADFTDAGIAYNNAQEAHKALDLADACWMLLDCIQAAGEGLVEGAYHTVDDIIHPVRTVQNIAESIATCGYYIGKVALEVGELSYLIIGEHPNKTHQKLEAWADTFAVIYGAIKEKSSTLKTRDVIKKTISLGTQFYTTPKALHGIGKLFKYAHKNALKLAENVSRSAKANSLTTPEGIIVRITDSTVDFMRSTQQLTRATILKAENMKEFFKLPFGQIMEPRCIKTKKVYRHIMPIYEIIEDIPGTTLKTGELFYLDRMHKDHLEIFHGTKYRSQSVYNLDGTLNRLKSKAAKGRSIKQYM